MEGFYVRQVKSFWYYQSMRTAEFEQHYNKLKARVDDLMITKAKEYAQENGDRLWNFHQPESLIGTNPARVGFLYCTKHYASLAKITEDIDKGIYPTPELVAEKCGDIISYTYLIYACLLELIEAQNKNGSISNVEAPQSDYIIELDN